MDVEQLYKVKGYLRVAGILWLVAFLFVMATVVFDVRANPEKYHLVTSEGGVLSAEELRAIQAEKAPKWEGSNVSFGNFSGGVTLDFGGYPEWVYETDELIFYKTFFGLIMGRIGGLFVSLLLLLGASNRVNLLLVEALEEELDAERGRIAEKVEETGDSL